MMRKIFPNKNLENFPTTNNFEFLHLKYKKIFTTVTAAKIPTVVCCEQCFQNKKKYSLVGMGLFNNRHKRAGNNK